MDMKPNRWSLVIHGGAGQITPERLGAAAEANVRVALNAAVTRASESLAKGGPALDAVETAVRVLEDAPEFNAAHGAALTYDGEVELDAAIMDGATRKAGAAAAITRTRHPISLARAIMERSPHVMLCGPGADAFSRVHGLEQADRDWFVLPERRRQLDQLKSSPTPDFDIDMKYGTVGAVACDQAGHVAAATSTGGVTGKRWGRIGDSPLIGCGAWADDAGAAVSATGAGEFFIRTAAAHEIAARVRLLGLPLQQAADGVMAEITALGGVGGVIAVTRAGEAIWSFTTAGMYRACAASDGTRAIEVFGKR